MSSSDTTSTSNYSQSSTVIDMKPTASYIQGGSAAYQPTIQGTNNSVSIVTESPQALAAAAEITYRAIDAASKAAQYAIGVGAEQFESSRELAERSTATSSEQGTKFVAVLGAIAVVLVGVWVFGDKKQGAKA